jgi:rod shape-determining protein MreC
LILYLFLAQYIKPTISSLLFPPLKFCQDLTVHARQFLLFQDLLEENKRLKAKVDNLSAQLAQLQEAALENQRLRKLLALSSKGTFQTQVALLISKDSSNWTKTIVINKGTLQGVKKGAAVVQGASLVGKVIEAGPFVSKVALIIDFNSKIPALIQRTREEGLVFGAMEKGVGVCKIKYIQDANIGDKVISSGLANIYPKGLLIGKLVAIEKGKDELYKIARIQPAVNFAKLEEVMVIINQ